ncbi:MAG: GGDEF domain-containing protein [Desulfuromonas sp.]|nr:MAG: GGDEF domain-containing protein [Desulfuromonas sp.]
MMVRSNSMVWLDEATGQKREPDLFTQVKGRVRLVAKARWLLLALFALYGVAAAVSFARSSYGFFLDRSQLITLVVTVVAVLGYNLCYHFCYSKLGRFRIADHIQVLLDLSFVTVLIHFSGGAASWFWPVYLLVTIEAAVLFERKLDVWIMGALGSLLYGGMLFAESMKILPIVPMPFVDPNLHFEDLFLGLTWCWVSVLNATVALISAFLMDVIRRENKNLSESEERLVDFLESANDLIFCVATDGRFLYVNNAWKETIGYQGEDLLMMRIFDVVHRNARAQSMAAFKKALAGEGPGSIEGYLVNKSGDEIAVEGNISCRQDAQGRNVVWGLFRDVTEKKRTQEQLYHLAHHDTLTGLPNRLHFHEGLKLGIANAKRLKHTVAILFLDLDRFKIINDTLGHAAGDALLIEVANRLREHIRETDQVGRFGGDEFAVMLGNLQGPDDAEKVAQKIIRAMAEPISIEGHELFVTTSIGIACYPHDDHFPADLIKKADTAMYSAKGKGRNNYQCYAADLDGDNDKRLMLENGIRKALDGDELCLYYQPKFDVATDRVNSMEALIRWNHPELGLLEPKDFISLAEETGMIFAIGDWVLRTACLQVKEWEKQGGDPIRIAVNVSGYQLQQRGFVAAVRQILGEVGLDPDRLELEVTETVIMQNPEYATKVLRQLRDLGVHISIDDFGTGYSSLSHLKRFAINTLKIDRSFVSEVDRNSTDAAIASAIIAMGKSLDLSVIAEGVETESQLAFLRKHDCDEIQGYLYSRPVPPSDAFNLLMQKNRVPYIVKA